MHVYPMAFGQNDVRIVCLASKALLDGEADVVLAVWNAATDILNVYIL